MYICRAVKHLLDVLKPHSIENGGALKVEHVSYVEGRGNLMVTYTSEGASGKYSTNQWRKKMFLNREAIKYIVHKARRNFLDHTYNVFKPCPCLC